MPRLKQPLRLVFVLSAISILMGFQGGCATTRTSVQTTDVACTVFSPITYSSRDTDPTVRQIRGHNAAFVATCEGEDS